MSYPHNQANKSRFHPAHKGQEGVVIIMALFIVAIVAAMAYTMMGRLSRDTRQTTLLVRNVEAENIAHGSVAWAMDRLRSDIVEKKPDKLVDPVPIKSPEQDINEHMVSSTIYDLQSRFNLNNLTDKKAQMQFLRLIRLVAPKVSQENAAEIVKATIDWITQSSQQNEFTKYYLALPHPYRAAHRAMVNASELRLVKGVTPVIYQALQPYIVALPTSTKINVQTAPAQVLASLSDKVSLQDAIAIVRLRSDKPLNTNPKSYELEVLSSGRFPMGDVGVVSQYFLVETKVSMDDESVLIYTLLSRDAKDSKATVSILGQTKGSW